MSIIFCNSKIAAEDWILKKIIKITDITGSSNFNDLALSPDGLFIAAARKDSSRLDIYTIPDFSRKTYPLPASFKGPVHYLAWSPSGKYIAFTEDYFRYMREPDIWIFDAETGQFKDLTDDGIDKNALSAGSDEKTMLDYLPVWDKNKDEIYFFRTRRSPHSDIYLTALYRIIPGRSPDKIMGLPGSLPRFSIFRPAAISPDGTHIAILIDAPNRNAPSNGIWVMNLKTGKMDQIALLSALINEQPDWIKNSAFFAPYDVEWSANNEGLILALINYPQEYVDNLVYYINMNTGKNTPLIDFSDISNRQQFMTGQENGKGYSYRVMQECILSPDRSTLFYLHLDQSSDEIEGVISLSALSLPPGGKPVILGKMDYAIMPQMILDRTIVLSAKNGYALLHRYPYLLQFEFK
jgi:WD40 repeat protein